ncbi:hypothetical protein C8R42DRAFT_722983 [Lentinula raphanica]|nr:hypothetical protein C8R42DRAFT_722983 [Lentinula raphanica]
MLQYIYSRGAFLGDSPHPTKGSDQTNLAASTVPASLNSKQSLNHRGKEPVNVNVSSQVQTVAVPKSWKDWDKETNQPNVELSYEPDPGEIIEHEGPVAISSTHSSSTASKPLGSTGHETEWGQHRGFEGIVRMNTGFEVIWCDFDLSSLRFVGSLNIMPSGTPEARRSFPYPHDATQRAGPSEFAEELPLRPPDHVLVLVEVEGPEVEDTLVVAVPGE